MDPKKIVATIDKKGVVTIDAQGFEGSSCATATAMFEAALGGAATRVEKSEFYLSDPVAKEQEQ